MLLKYAAFKNMHLDLGVLWICSYMTYNVMNAGLMRNFDYL